MKQADTMPKEARDFILDHMKYAIPKEIIRLTTIEGLLGIYHKCEAASVCGGDKAEARREIDKRIAELYREDKPSDFVASTDEIKTKIIYADGKPVSILMTMGIGPDQGANMHAVTESIGEAIHKARFG